MTREEIQAEIATCEAERKALLEQKKPIDAKLTRLYNKINKLIQELADLDAGDFEALLRNPSASKQMNEYIKSFLGTSSQYVSGIGASGYYMAEDGSDPEQSFDLYLYKEKDIPLAEKFLSNHIQYFHLRDQGWDRPFVRFSFDTDSGGLDWLGWDGSHWYIIRFCYGSVRGYKKKESLREALEAAFKLKNRKADYDDD